MKKITRTLIAALLAALTVLNCTSAAFAANSSNKLLWDYYGWECYYDYAGELTAGKNTINTPENSSYCYYVFNAEESGYYTLGYTDYVFEGWTGVPEETENGVAFNEAEYLYHRSESNMERYTFRFEEGENIIGFDLYDDINGKTFEIVFEGKEIESVRTADTLLLGRDIYSYGDCCEIYSETVFTFSSGKTASVNYIYAKLYRDIQKGKNTVRYVAFGETKDVEIEVYLITDIIKDVEVSNIEDYLNAKVYYSGYEGFCPSGETVTFTFTNGESTEIVYENNGESYVTLPDSSEAFFYFSTDNTDGDITLSLMVANTAVKTYDCKETKATFDENLIIMADSEKYYLSKASRYFRLSLIALLDCDSFYELKEYGINNFGYYLQYSLEYFLRIFGEFNTLIAYYI